jgi:hypothetical protein
MRLIERLSTTGPKRILALDGGGIRGALTLGLLAKIENMLRARHRNPNLRLCDYFDLIGGTSTGAIIAAGLSIGMETSEISRMYLELGGNIFGRKQWRRWQAFFDPKRLESELAHIFGDRQLGDTSIQTGLCIVTKRADTGSTWPLINHPSAKYYAENSQILLRNAVRASTAAPTYFIPVKFDVGNREIGAFVDGGVSMANNPALLLFLVATLKGFPFHWAVGEDKLLLVSVGTGHWRNRQSADTVVNSRLWDWAREVPAMLMNDASLNNQLILQYLSHTATPVQIDSEIGSLSSDLLTHEPALTYLRYDVVLESEALKALGVPEFSTKVALLRKMEHAENRFDLARIGELAAEQQIREEHFPAVFDLPAR